SYFFFSSRRRHTRFSRDWSSDVCSSDLEAQPEGSFGQQIPHLGGGVFVDGRWCGEFQQDLTTGVVRDSNGEPAHETEIEVGPNRSEERRVGKETRERWKMLGEVK